MSNNVKLAVLGSNKLVTTINSIVTEIFTGLSPSKIIILKEKTVEEDNELSGKMRELKEVLRYLNVNCEIEVKEIPAGFETWIKEVGKMDFDVIDITPGRKYMAIASYFSSKHSRYTYIKDESKGYRIFGFIPFEEVEVWDLVKRQKIPLKPVNCEAEGDSKLNSEALTSLYNILSMHGEIGVKVKDEVNMERVMKVDEIDEEAKPCYLRSGIWIYKEERELAKVISDQGGNLKLAFDTNMYVNLGRRIKDFGNVIPLESVYNELDRKVKLIQKNSLVKDKVFLLGMESYNEIHNVRPRRVGKQGGDVGILEEIKEVRKEAGNLIFVTGDKTLAEKARVSNTIVMEFKEVERTKEKTRIGEFLECLSRLYKVYLTLNDEEVVEIKYSASLGITPHTSVKTLKRGLSYAKLLEGLSKLIN
jgi:hypothetical protein